MISSERRCHSGEEKLTEIEGERPLLILIGRSYLRAL